jgi:ferredoxin-thioredoxin reductase catalytic chain
MIEKQAIIESMKKNAKENGYYVCPDTQLFNDLIEGLAKNITRHGYGSCPCRIASGVKKYDADIICPCEYRDADVDKFGMCYCGLFVSKKIKNNPSRMKPIPERRPPEIMDAVLANAETKQTPAELATDSKSGKDTTFIKVWRCNVCGYLCARELPPPICPICKAKAERFEQFVFNEKN